MKFTPNRYVIVGPARSGTTVTHLCLAGHPNVSAVTDEVRVEPFFTRGLSTFTHGNDEPEEKKKSFIVLFDTLASLHRTEKTTTFGLKTAISSSKEAQTFCRSMVENFPSVKVVLTVRDDIVAQYGSLQRAKVTGHWHSWVKPEKKLDEKIHLNAKRLHNHAVEYLNTLQTLRSLQNSHDCFEISFEKDILLGQDIYHELFKFLDLPDAQIDWLNSNKVAPPPGEFIADYSEHTETVRELRHRFEANPSQFASIFENGNKDLGIFRRISRQIFRT